jgi:hypothetical protein
MADNLGKFYLPFSPLSISNLSHRDSWFIGYPICPTTPALVAGAVFGTLYSGSLSLFSCWIIGNLRNVPA